MLRLDGLTLPRAGLNINTGLIGTVFLSLAGPLEMTTSTS